MAVHSLSFIPLSYVQASNAWALNSPDGAALVGGTFTFHADSETSTISISDDDSVFEDDDNGDGWGDNGEPQTLSAATEIGGTNYPAGTAAEAEYAITIQDTSNGTSYKVVAVKVGSEVVGFSFVDETPPFGTTFEVTENHDSFFDDDGNYVAIGIGYDELVPCFSSGTLIETDRGLVEVSSLRAGDLIVTRDSGLQPIRWIGSRKLGATTLAKAKNLRPIRIRAGSLGKDIPAADLVVSPQHRVLVRSKIAQRLFCTDEVLVAAKHLLDCAGVEIAEDMEEVEYVHFLFDKHEVVFSNGAETESLYTGPQALKSVGAAALAEIFAIFPELRDRNPQVQPEGARMLLTGREGRKLAHRHIKNCQPLIT